MSSSAKKSSSSSGSRSQVKSTLGFEYLRNSQDAGDRDETASNPTTPMSEKKPKKKSVVASWFSSSSSKEAKEAERERRSSTNGTPKSHPGNHGHPPYPPQYSQPPLSYSAERSPHPAFPKSQSDNPYTPKALREKKVAPNQPPVDYGGYDWRAQEAAVSQAWATGAGKYSSESHKGKERVKVNDILSRAKNPSSSSSSSKPLEIFSSTKVPDWVPADVVMGGGDRKVSRGGAGNSGSGRSSASAPYPASSSSHPSSNNNSSFTGYLKPSEHLLHRGGSGQLHQVLPPQEKTRKQAYPKSSSSPSASGQLPPLENDLMQISRSNGTREREPSLPNGSSFEGDSSHLPAPLWALPENETNSGTGAARRQRGAGGGSHHPAGAHRGHQEALQEGPARRPRHRNLAAEEEPEEVEEEELYQPLPVPRRVSQQEEGRRGGRGGRRGGGGGRRGEEVEEEEEEEEFAPSSLKADPPSRTASGAVAPPQQRVTRSSLALQKAEAEDSAASAARASLRTPQRAARALPRAKEEEAGRAKEEWEEEDEEAAAEAVLLKEREERREKERRRQKREEEERQREEEALQERLMSTRAWVVGNLTMRGHKGVIEAGSSDEEEEEEEEEEAEEGQEEGEEEEEMEEVKQVEEKMGRVALKGEAWEDNRKPPTGRKVADTESDRESERGIRQKQKEKKALEEDAVAAMPSRWRVFPTVGPGEEEEEEEEEEDKAEVAVVSSSARRQNNGEGSRARGGRSQEVGAEGEEGAEGEGDLVVEVQAVGGDSSLLPPKNPLATPPAPSSSSGKKPRKKRPDSASSASPVPLHPIPSPPSSVAPSTASKKGSGGGLMSALGFSRPPAGSSSGGDKKSILGQGFADLALQYELQEDELGRGRFGVIRVCVERVSGERLACKSISKKRLKCAQDVEDVRREVAVMEMLKDHPDVVHLKATYEDAKNVHLVMELCEGGELFDRIKLRKYYSERKAAKVMKTIVEVLAHCHSLGIIHRDLKPENILLCSPDDDITIKVIDYGVAAIVKKGKMCKDMAGSPFYLAPEVLGERYGPPADVWSAGVVLYILLSGIPPFWAPTNQGIFEAIKTAQVNLTRKPWPSISDTAKDLVSQMLTRDPKKRITPEEILLHPFIAGSRNGRKVSSRHDEY